MPKLRETEKSKGSGRYVANKTPAGKTIRPKNPTPPEPAEGKALTTGGKEAGSKPIEGFLKLIEGEIIPRLMLAHRTRRLDQDPGEGSGVIVGEDEVERLTNLTLGSSYETCFEFVMRLRRRGAESDQLLMHLLAPVARRLGELWETDESDFVSVTVGLGHLQTIMRELGRMAAPPMVKTGAKRRALLSTVPGEQHTFGLLVIEDHLRRGGWEVEGAMATAYAEELVARVKKEWFAVIGLSMSDSRWRDSARSGVLALRRASRNRDIFVLVGGLAFQKEPDLIEEVGADAAAQGGPEAVYLAEKYLAGAGHVDYQGALGKQMGNQIN